MDAFITVLKHNEQNPSVWHPRHPPVVWTHLPFAILLAGTYLAFADGTVGQQGYFLVMIGLYLSSTAYHTWRPDWLIRFADQTLISWYIIVTPLPFVYHNPAAVTYIVVAMAASAANKWYAWERNCTDGSLVFFSLGAVSTLLVFLVGLPTADVSCLSAAGVAVQLSIVCFVGKLLIYHFQKLRLIPGYWEAPESGHFVLAIGVTIYTAVVLVNPV